jgi:hypothetical protein
MRFDARRVNRPSVSTAAVTSTLCLALLLPP